MAYVGTPRYLGTDQATLASIIYGEAGNQGLVGMQAVGAVMTNRNNGVAGFTGYGQGQGIMAVALAPGQFQGQSSNYSAQAYAVAGDVLNGTNPDPTGGATYYAVPSASSASWAQNLNSSNSYQIGAHFFTDNQNGVPFSPNFSTGGASNGPVDNSQGGTPASGDPNPLGTGSYLTGSPYDPYQGDYTSTYPDPNTAFDTTGGASAATPGLGATDAPGAVGTTPGMGSQAAVNQSLTQTGEGAASTVAGLSTTLTSNIDKWIGNIESSVGGAFSGAVKAAENAIGTYFGSITNWFVRAFLIIVGIVILFAALIALMWDHGGKETVVSMGKMAAA